MVEQALAGRDRRARDRARARSTSASTTCAMFTDRPASRRGRRAVRRRTGNGAEAGADVPGARRNRRATATRLRRVILTSPQGTPFHAAGGAAPEPGCARLALLAAADTKGVDERIRSRVDEEIVDRRLRAERRRTGRPGHRSIAVARLVPGVVGDEQSVADDSFSRGLLDFPHYTRPAELA